MALAQQQRNSEAEVVNYKVYEEQRVQAELALGKGRPQEALHALADLPLAQIPLSTRLSSGSLAWASQLHVATLCSRTTGFADRGG